MNCTTRAAIDISGWTSRSGDPARCDIALLSDELRFLASLERCHPDYPVAEKTAHSAQSSGYADNPPARSKSRTFDAERGRSICLLVEFRCIRPAHTIVSGRFRGYFSILSRATQKSRSSRTSALDLEVAINRYPSATDCWWAFEALVVTSGWPAGQTVQMLLRFFGYSSTVRGTAVPQRHICAMEALQIALLTT